MFFFNVVLSNEETSFNHLIVDSPAAQPVEGAWAQPTVGATHGGNIHSCHNLCMLYYYKLHCLTCIDKLTMHL